MDLCFVYTHAERHTPLGGRLLLGPGLGQHDRALLVLLELLSRYLILQYNVFYFVYVIHILLHYPILFVFVIQCEKRAFGTKLLNNKCNSSGEVLLCGFNDSFPMPFAMHFGKTEHGRNVELSAFYLSFVTLSQTYMTGDWHT